MSETKAYTLTGPNHFAAGAKEPTPIGTVLELTDKQAANLIGKVEPLDAVAQTSPAESVDEPTEAPKPKPRARRKRTAKAE